MRETLRNGKSVWEADLPAEGANKRVRLFAPTQRELKRKVEAHTIKTGQVATLGPLPGPVYAVAARWCEPGRLTAEEIDAACREYSARKGLCATAADAVAGYLGAPREAPLSKEYLTSLNVRLNAFKARFGPAQLATITAGDVSDFCREKGRSAPDYFSSIRALFRYAHSREWILVNPFDRLTKPELAPIDKELLTPDQMRKLLRIAAGVDEGLGGWNGTPLLRLLVLGGFCGLRHAEGVRADCAAVDRQSWEIHVGNMKTQRKGMRERYAQTEANARLWLSWLDLPASGPIVAMTDKNLRDRRQLACEKAGVGEWPHNVLRRSFASYHLAAFGDAARTAEILGHTDAETTKAKYRVARKKEIAEAWFALTPESVLG